MSSQSANISVMASLNNFESSTNNIFITNSLNQQSQHHFNQVIKTVLSGYILQKTNREAHI